MQKDIYSMEVTDGLNTYDVPVYTCGHCSRVVALRPLYGPESRTRPRTDCYTCGRIICEKSEICRTACTPIHRLAADNALDDPKWGKFIPAIMAGITNVNEAQELGLVRSA